MSNKELNIKEEHEAKSQKVDIMRVFLFLVGVACIGIAIYGLLDIYLEYKKGDDAYGNLGDEYVVTEDMEETEQVKGPWYELASVDVEALQKQYEDVVGWLFFEDEEISYPIMQGEDNNEYLHKTYDGKNVKAGSIFLDYIASDDYSDTHTIIYGHNMKNLSMFGRLRYYRTHEGYYDDHMYFQIFTDTEILRYQIFSYQVVPITSFIYDRNHTSAKTVADELMKSAINGTHLDIKDEDKIITLSTCVDDDEERFIVNAVLVDRYEIKK